MTFTSTIISDPGNLAAPFWSLATEWHFYLVLPLLIWAIKKWGFWPVSALAILICFSIRTWYYISLQNNVSLPIQWNWSIPIHLVEFIWGMCVARLYMSNINPPKLFQRWWGFLSALGVAFLGRLLMVNEITKWAGKWGALCQIIGVPLLTLGFSFIIWNVLCTPSIFQKALSSNILQAIGRWSYSIYLWHWWVCGWITTMVQDHFGSTTSTQYLAFLITLLLIIPLSWISYTFLEKPYFRKHDSQEELRRSGYTIPTPS